MYYIGIDLGGTNIAVGVVDKDGNIIYKDSTPTNAPRSAEAYAEDMVSMCYKVVEGAKLTMDDIAAIGLGSPGSIDNENGMVVSAGNLGIKNAQFRKLIQQKIDKRVTIENDANAAAYGEYMVNGDGAESFVCITLGTGIGSGIIIDGKLYTGCNHAGGEFGHVTIDMNGIKCNCGQNGCWEQYASATALINQTKEAIEKNPDSMMVKWVEENGKVSGRTAFDCAKKGDKAALNVVENFQKYLAAGLLSVVNIFQPDKITVGGGISAEGEYLLGPVRDMVFCKAFYNGDRKNPVLEVAKLRNDAGIIGAAMCAAI